MDSKKIETITGVDIDLIAGGGGECGWNPYWGDETTHKYVVPAIEPDSRVLDIASGFGRCSFPMAMKGAKVTLVDRSSTHLDMAMDTYINAGMADRLEALRIADVTRINPTDFNGFDVVVASNVLTHMTKSQGLELVNITPGFLSDRGGTVVIDGPSEQGWYHEQLAYGGYPSPEPGTYEDVCSCSGEDKVENFSFYTPGEIENVLKEKGGEIVFAEDIETPYLSGNYLRQVVAKFDGST